MTNIEHTSNPAILIGDSFDAFIDPDLSWTYE